MAGVVGVAMLAKKFGPQAGNYINNNAAKAARAAASMVLKGLKTDKTGDSNLNACIDQIITYIDKPSPVTLSAAAAAAAAPAPAGGSRRRKTRGRKTRGRKTRGRKTRGRKTRGRKTRRRN